MDAKTYLETYGPAQTEKVCKKAGTTLNYYRQCACLHRCFSRKLAKRLVTASNGELTLIELLDPKERVA